MKLMSKPQQRRYLSYQRDNRTNKDSYYSNSDTMLFRQYDKRLNILKTDNPFKFENIMNEYFAGNYIYDIDTFCAYLLLNYKKEQTGLVRVMEEMNVSKYHREKLESYCLGLQVRYRYEVITASFTNDLDTINIKIWELERVLFSLS